MNFFVNKKQVTENEIYVINSDVNHIKNVLRKKVGDIIFIVCEKIVYKCEIIDFYDEKVHCKILEKTQSSNDEPRITIFQGLSKADKIEYVIQKCTELGVYKIIPVEMKRCVVRLDSKDKDKKIERWKKIAEVAAKQSQRDDVLKIENIFSATEMYSSLEKYDLVIMAYEKENKIFLKDILKTLNKEVSNIAVIVGPEGGIDDDEAKEIVSHGAKSVSLGKRILRTETAPIVISAIVMYELAK